MIIKNATTKTVTLVNGIQIKPKESIKIDIKKGTELYEQVSGLIEKGILD